MNCWKKRVQGEANLQACMDCGSKKEAKMAFYIHLGCVLSGNGESNRVIDRWIHMAALRRRLDIMSLVFEL
jgi:hypothetical protein